MLENQNKIKILIQIMARIKCKNYLLVTLKLKEFMWKKNEFQL